MTPEQIKRVKELLQRVAESAPERIGAFLDEACPDDAEVRAEVERLHSQDTQATLLSPGMLSVSTLGSELVGTHIGPYRVLRLIGEGGMGAVYEAEQEEPVRRKVALKLVKWGMDTRQVVARFESERQALALMRHPHIAAVYDGGATEQGRPYFAMELVDGVPITRYCDERRLGNPERLELFAAVCEGVQHAHQKGIIHRDIKPTNVLVEERDGKAVPKIIDFGVAKATEIHRQERSVLTELGQLIGTPDYMSPEQAAAAPDIDTRTDVYSLGVLLYELLVGTLPIEASGVRAAGFDEIRRKIIEDEPPKPSRRLTPDKRSTATARRRNTNISGLRRQLRGDLDWIAMRALEKERDRRYSSVSELASDVHRHLRDEPISAGPPSATYRVRKFVRRHRLVVGAATAVAVAVLGGSAFAIQGFIRARQAERVAVEKAATAESVTDFMVQLFQVADPGAASGNRVTARELLDRGAEQIAEELAGQPEAQAHMMVAMGNAYSGLGLFPEAEGLLAQGVDTQRERLEPDDPRLSEGLLQLGALQLRQGRAAEAEATFRESMSLIETERGPSDPDVGVALRHVARALSAQAKYDEATTSLERSIELIDASWGGDSLESARSNSSLAWLLHSKGASKEALEIYDRILPVFETANAESHELAWCLSDSAVVLTGLRELAEAQARIERAIDILQEVYGARHPDVASMLDNAGTIYWYRHMVDEAADAYERALAIREHTLGPDHPDLAGSLNNIGLVRRSQKRYAEALAAYERAETIFRDALGDDHPRVANVLVNRGWVVRQQGRYEEAIPYYRQALAIRETSLGKQHPDVGKVLENLAGTHGYGLEDPETALPLAVRAHQVYQAAFGEDHMRTRKAIGLVGDLRCKAGDIERGLPLLESFLEFETERLGEEHWAVGNRQADLGACLLLSGETVAARKAIERALEIYDIADYRRVSTARALTDLARTLEALGEPAAAEKRYIEAIEMLEEQNQQSHLQYRKSTVAYRDFLQRRKQVSIN